MIYFSRIGEFVIFLLNVLKKFKDIKKRRYEILKQMKRIGVDSLLLIIITSAFTGFVTAVQASYQTQGYIPKSLIGVLVGKTTLIELAPVLTGLVLAGKVGAGMAAEIGSMKASEQLDAMHSMAIDKFSYLFMPRILSGIIMVPILKIIADLVGILSSFFISKFFYNINAATFFSGMRNFFIPSDLWGGLTKALFFGLIITSVGCFQGSISGNDALGVGKATTLTVVFSSILILIFDFIVAIFIFGGLF